MIFLQLNLYLTLNYLCAMMDDYITKEVSKTRAAVESVLKRLSQLSGKAASAEIHDYVKTEMSGKLGLDIDSILSKDDFISTLVSKFHFDNDDLNRFAEILYTMLKADEGKDEVHNAYARAIVKINKWLEEKGVTFSATRHYVLEEMNRYF